MLDYAGARAVTMNVQSGSVEGAARALNPACLVRDHLARGELVELLPDTPLDVPLFWQVSRLAAERLTGLTQAAQAAAGDQLL